MLSCLPELRQILAAIRARVNQPTHLYSEKNCTNFISNTITPWCGLPLEVFVRIILGTDCPSAVYIPTSITQWNLSIAATLRELHFGCYTEVAVVEGFYTGVKLN